MSAGFKLYPFEDRDYHRKRRSLGYGGYADDDGRVWRGNRNRGGDIFSKLERFADRAERTLSRFDHTARRVERRFDRYSDRYGAAGEDFGSYIEDSPPAERRYASKSSPREFWRDDTDDSSPSSAPATAGVLSTGGAAGMFSNIGDFLGHWAEKAFRFLGEILQTASNGIQSAFSSPAGASERPRSAPPRTERRPSPDKPLWDDRDAPSDRDRPDPSLDLENAKRMTIANVLNASLATLNDNDGGKNDEAGLKNIALLLKESRETADEGIALQRKLDTIYNEGAKPVLQTGGSTIGEDIARVRELIQRSARDDGILSKPEATEIKGELLSLNLSRYVVSSKPRSDGGRSGGD
jgi:hypothetical protein